MSMGSVENHSKMFQVACPGRRINISLPKYGDLLHKILQPETLDYNFTIL